MIDKLIKWVSKYTMRIVILLASIIVFVVANNVIKDCQYKRQWNKEVQEMSIKGISDVTRSCHPDTIKQDTIK